ncbi:MAG TPA: PLD nuclease N-terminal domain-containing protein [Anaerolineaceae bacterium]|nr:PLD nuclease N-terminal domain-containing protein [Anaerolineaceae bacterium]
MDWNTYLPLIIPLVILQLGVQIYALVDLSKRETVKGPKWAWAIAIILGQLIGPIVYLLFGRVEE